MNWLNKPEIGLQRSKNTKTIRNISTDERWEKVFNQYEDLFKNNHTIKGLKIDIQLKKDTKPFQQEERKAGTHPFSEHGSARIREANRKRTH